MNSKEISLKGTDPSSFKLITEFCSIEQLKNGVIIEFNYIPEEDLFKPYRLRLDKEHPNSEITINNTLKNIEEAITIDDLFNGDDQTQTS